MGFSPRRRISRREFIQASGATGLSLLLSACAGEAGQAGKTRQIGADYQPQDQEEPEEKLDVVVIGAGIAGLSAAYFLRDYNIRILEKEMHVGGRTLSGYYKDFTYAKGTAYLREPNGALKSVIQQLGLQPKEIPSPEDAAYYNNEFYYGKDGLALMSIEHGSLGDLNRFMAVIQEYYGVYRDVPGFDMKSDLANLDEISAQEWFEHQNLPGVFRDTHNVTSRGKFGANLGEISALSYIHEAGKDYETSKPVSSISELRNSPVSGKEKADSYSFLTGITEVTDALALSLGDRVSVGIDVSSVLRRGSAYLVSFTDFSGGKHTLQAKVVILAVPAPIALQIAPLVLENEQKRILEQIPYAAFLTATLFCNESVLEDTFKLAVPDDWFFTNLFNSTRIQRYYDNTIEDQSASILGVHVAPKSFSDRSILELSYEQVLENIFRDLEKLIPPLRNIVLGADVHRFPYAYPVMTVGAYRRLTRLHRITKGTLLLAGDYMVYPTFDAAAESGSLAAQEALARLL